MDILRLKRSLLPYGGWLNEDGDGEAGGSMGSSNNGPSSSDGPGDNGPSSTDGPTTDRGSELGTSPNAPDAPSDKDNPDAQSPDREAFSPAIDSEKANKDIGLTPGMTAREVDIAIGNMPGPNPNTDQTIGQFQAAQNVHGFMNTAVPAIAALANPGFGLAMSAAKAVQAGDMKGFVGGLVGGYLGTSLGPLGKSLGTSLGTSLARGQTPDVGKMATDAAIGAVTGAANRAVSNSTRSSVAGSIAGAATGAVIRGAIGK